MGYHAYPPPPPLEMRRSANLLDLRHPVPNGVEGLLVRHVVNEKDSLRASEVRGCDRAEAFLPGRVPDLKLDSLGIAEEVTSNQY